MDLLHSSFDSVSQADPSSDTSRSRSIYHSSSLDPFNSPQPPNLGSKEFSPEVEPGTGAVAEEKDKKDKKDKKAKKHKKEKKPKRPDAREQRGGRRESSR